MFLKKSIYTEVGGFDTDYFMYGEDIDLSYRVLKKGYKNYYFSDSQIIHYKGESTNRDVVNLTDFKNAMKLFYKKHFKQSFFYSVIIKFGIEIWFLMNVINLKTSKEISKLISNVLYVGHDEELKKYLVEKYKNVLNLELYSYSKLIEIISREKIDSVVFDNSSIAFKQIISSVESLKNQSLLIKIRPKNTNFLVSSNSSKNKGIIENF
jgi:hypothetical protein